jgi:hypothetical protein
VPFKPKDLPIEQPSAGSTQGYCRLDHSDKSQWRANERLLQIASGYAPTIVGAVAERQVNVVGKPFDRQSGAIGSMFDRSPKRKRLVYLPFLVFNPKARLLAHEGFPRGQYLWHDFVELPAVVEEVQCYEREHRHSRTNN